MLENLDLWILKQSEIALKERVKRLHTLDKLLTFLVRYNWLLYFSNLLAVNVLCNHSSMQLLVHRTSLRLKSQSIKFYNFQPVEPVIVCVHLSLHLFKVNFFCMVFYVSVVNLFLLLHHSQRFIPHLFLRPPNLFCLLGHLLIKSWSFFCHP